MGDAYTQKLVDTALAGHPAVLITALHPTPFNSKTNIIIGSNFGRIGKAADEDELRVINTRKPTVGTGHVAAATA
jgi:hypothetical protein